MTNDMTWNLEVNQSIIHGTLRNEDLAYAFASALLRWAESNCKMEDMGYVASIYQKPELADIETVIGLVETLEAMAPEGFYFGPHIGNGSDFGFWELEDVD